MNDAQQPETAVGWDEAAVILGWKVETLKKRTAARSVPHIRVGKSITFLPSVLRQWMVDQSLDSLRPQHATEAAPRRKGRVHL
jgi:hypothetical protein